MIKPDLMENKFKPKWENQLHLLNPLGYFYKIGQPVLLLVEEEPKHYIEYV